MTVHVSAGCTCGAALNTKLPTLTEAVLSQEAWMRVHRGPGHRPCALDEARRIAKARKVRT